MADEFEIETDEDPIFATISPKKVNKWGIIALGMQWATDLLHATGDFTMSLGCAATQRYLYEADRSNWAAEAAREIDAFEGFYLVAADEVAEEEGPE
jgi:hypothetical protein